MIRRILARLITAFAVQPAWRGATLPEHREERVDLDPEEKLRVEMDIQCMAGHLADSSAYAGACTALPEQVAVMLRAKNTRMRNACLSGKAEYEEFVRARTL